MDLFLISPDPEQNPLLDSGLRAGLPGWWLAVALVVLGLLFAWMTFTDVWRGLRIPNIVTIPTYLGVLLASPLVFEDWKLHIALSLGAALIFGLVAVLTGGVGLGDVKLYTLLLLVFGLAGIYIVVLTQILAIIFAAPYAIASRTKKLRVPMAPFAALATIIVIVLMGARMEIAGAMLALQLVALAWGLRERRVQPLPSWTELTAPLSLNKESVLWQDNNMPQPLTRSFDPLAPEAAGGTERDTPAVANTVPQSPEASDEARKPARGTIERLAIAELSERERDDLYYDGEVRTTIPDHPDLVAQWLNTSGGFKLYLHRPDSGAPANKPGGHGRTPDGTGDSATTSELRRNLDTIYTLSLISLGAAATLAAHHAYRKFRRSRGSK